MNDNRIGDRRQPQSDLIDFPSSDRRRRPFPFPEPPENEALRVEVTHLLIENRQLRSTIDFLRREARPKGPAFKGVPLNDC